MTITNNSAGGAGSFGGGLVAGANATIANSIVAGNMADTSPDVFGSVLQSGNNLLSGNPMLGPLQDNGGPTFTHMPLAGSPALDAGDTGVALSAGLTTDQRGVPFARILDAADADPFPAVDLGAVEADPVVEVLTDKTIDEDGSVVVTFNVGDATTPFDSIVAVASPVSGDPGLLPNTPANVNVSGFGSTRTLTLTPAPNLSGSALVTVTATKMIGGALRTSTTSFTLTVNAVNDPPTLDPIAPVVLPEDAPLQTVNLTGISAGGARTSS